MSLVAELERALGPAAVVSEPPQVRTYECDGLTGHRATPQAVVLPRTTAEVRAAVRVCHERGIPFVARGAGTGLSGGAVPVAEGIVIGLARMNSILEVDVPNRRVRLQPGVTNLAVTRAVAPHGLYYAPDPSSQQVCTIGGNVAENSGGAHCLKYGFTSNHVVEAELVLAGGEVVRLGEGDALDLLGAVVGSEGTLGIVTEVVVGVLPRPQRVETLLAAFVSTDHAGEAVSAIIAGGIIPAAIEMMDELTIHAAEAAVGAGLPLDAGAVLLVELDGPVVEVELLMQRGIGMFRAGDGNLHPLVLYDGAVEGEAARAEELASEILTACIDAGGSLTGEHGIGLDKARHMPRMFSDADLDAMNRLRCGFDPDGRCN